MESYYNFDFLYNPEIHDWKDLAQDNSRWLIVFLPQPAIPKI